MHRIATALLVSAPLAAALAGCTASGQGTVAPGTAAPGSAAPGSGAPGSAAPGSAAAGAPAQAAGAGPSTAGRPGVAPRCHSRDLKVTWKPDPAGGAAGSHGEFLVFTNASDHRCTLYGFPGVSFVAGDKGTQVNDPFTRSGEARKTVTLAPGAPAHAVLVLVNPANFDNATCAPRQVRGYRVYPPDETAAFFVSVPQIACSAKGTGVAQVLPIGPGASE
jgi:Protein of unknown function (DUF4232)